MKVCEAAVCECVGCNKIPPQNYGNICREKANMILEYRIAKRPYESEKMWQCPSCHRNLTDKRCIKKMYAYCPKCGQALDWNGITEIKMGTFDSRSIVTNFILYKIE